MGNIEKIIGKETEKRKSVLKDLFLFMKNTGRFSVLVLGERGTGKTKWIKQFADILKENKIKWCNNLITASCASFGKDDLNAEAELFGYEKGAFTGSNPKGKEGLFIEADKGFLFLDELHHLSLKVQAKLLTVLQTESSGKNQGKFPVRRIHSSENKYVEVRVIFGSNLPIEKLKETLLPDLYDRIAQLVVELPPLEKNEIVLRKYFTQIFENMNQKEGYTSDSRNIAQPEIEDLYKWIPTINLEGNFRDLEKIAILWGQLYLKHNKDEVEIFNDVKAYYEKSNPSILGKLNNVSFSLTKTYEDYLVQFQKQYAEFISSTLIYKKARQGDTIKEVGRTKKVIEGWLKL